VSKLRVTITCTAVLSVLFASILALAAPASAHDELVKSSPADGATLTELPSTVTLFFEEPPAAGFTTMSVSGPDGSVNSTGPQVVGSRISESLKATNAAGAYAISFRIMSDDGHSVSGTIHFTVGAAAAPASKAGNSAAPAASHAQGSASSTTIAYVAGAIVLVVIVLAAAAPGRTRRYPAPR
jgi:methionine-rich copper-binding protein CopC